MRNHARRFVSARPEMLVGIFAAAVVAIAAFLTAASADPLTAIDVITVDSANPAGANTNISLNAGTAYRVRATGTFAYRTASGYLADAECSIAPGERFWTDARADDLDLVWQGSHIAWAPVAPKGDGCNELDFVQLGPAPSHVYQTIIQVGTTGIQNFKISDLSSYADNTGSLTVEIFPVDAPVISPTLPPTPNPTSPPTPNPTLPPTPNPTVPPTPNPTAPPTLPPTPNPTMPPTPNPTLPPTPNPTALPTLPPTPSPTLPPTPSPTPPPPPPTMVLVDTISVDVTSALGTDSNVTLVAGREYVVEASGTWTYDNRFGGLADAECWKNPLGPGYPTEPGWDRSGNTYDLYISNTPVEWVPQVPNQYGCDETNHTYSTALAPDEPEKINLRVQDPIYSDNAGSLTVRIFEILRIGPSSSTSLGLVRFE